MAIQHINRKGETFYLLVGKTKTGRPKYYTSKKPHGTPVNEIPTGYEIHESPTDALVHVRKIRPTRLVPEERSQVNEAVRSLAGIERFIVDIDCDSLVVYLPNTDADRSASAIIHLLGGTTADFQSLKEWTEKTTRYTAMMRFSLVDADRRLFSAERWCFRGSIDNWFPLSAARPLAQLLKEYVPHLGQETFYELM